MPFAKINNIKIYYEIFGSGPPIFFISGFSNHHKVWLPFIQLLSNKYQLILFDNRGSGQSSCPSFPYTIDLLAEDTHSLINYLGFDSTYMVGASMGCAIIQTLALKNPKQIKKGVLISPFAKLPHTTFVKSLSVGKLLQEKAPLNLIIEGILPWLYSNHFLSNPTKVNSLIKDMTNNPYPQTIKGFLGQLSALKYFDLRQHLTEIMIPFLIIAGEQDLSTPLYCAEELTDNLPDTQLYSIPEMGHMAHYERRAQVANLIQEFFF